MTLGTPARRLAADSTHRRRPGRCLRVAASIAEPLGESAAGAMLGQLVAALDGAAGPLGPALPASAIPAIGPLPVESVPGLAIGSAIGGDLVGLLSGAAIAAAGSAAGTAPTHLAFGVGARLDVAAAAPGDIAVDVHTRVSLGRIALQADAPEPTRPAFAGTVALRVRRPDGWLVGAESGALGANDQLARVRWLEAGVSVTPGAPGAVDAQPWLRLHDAGIGGVASTVLSLADQQLQQQRFAPVLDALLAELEAAADGTPARQLLDLLRAAGIVLDTADGVRAALTGLAEIVSTPTRTLAARQTQLLGALREIAGLPAGPMTLDLGSGLELALDVDAGTLHLRTTQDVVLAEPFTLSLDVGFSTATFMPQCTATLGAGVVVLSVAAAGQGGGPTATVRLAAPPWLQPLTLVPFDATAAEHALTSLLPRMAISGAISALLGPRVASTIGPIDVLLSDPVAWLRRDEALGTGGRIDGDKVNGLLKTIADALGLDASEGLGLPGGYLLRSAGTDPLRFDVSGTFGDALVATLGIDLAVDVHPAGGVTPGGTLTATVVLPGDWGTIAIALSADSGGVGLVVTPENENVDPIRLLPSVNGLGTLMAGATALLPRILQEVVTRIQSMPGTHDVIEAALDVAEAFGIYSDDPAGFESPAASARLRAMLQPGWLEQEVADSGPLVDAVVALFAPGRLPLPTGHTVTRVEERLRWSIPVVDECHIIAEIGWTAGSPHILIGIDSLNAGPVVLVEARLGLVGSNLAGLVVMGVDAGDDLAFFAPRVELSVDAVGLAVSILPLGPDAATDLQIDIVPQPAVTMTTDGAFQLVEAWLVPLATTFLLPLFEDVLRTAVWEDGPSPLSILEQARLVEENEWPPVLRADLPPLPEWSLRGLASLVNGASIELTGDLTLTAVIEDDRYGLRLQGFVTIPGEGEDGVDVTIRFGTADWLDDPSAGITVWVLKDDPAAQPPIAIDPRLAAIGIGVMVSGHDSGQLIGGPVAVGGIGGLIFFEASFIEAGQVNLDVVDGGAAIEVERAQISLDSGDADSFVAKVLPKELQAPFSLALAYRNDQLEIHGGIGGAKDGIQLTFPLELDLFHVIYLKELYLQALVRQGRTEAIAAISGNASLGPLAIAVTRVGLRVVVDGSGAHLRLQASRWLRHLDGRVRRAGRRLPARRRGPRPLRRRARDRDPQEVLADRDRHHHHEEARRHARLLAAAAHHDRRCRCRSRWATDSSSPAPAACSASTAAWTLDRLRDGLRTGTADCILFPTDIIRRIDTIVRDLEESLPAAPTGPLPRRADGDHHVDEPRRWSRSKLGIIIEIADPPKIALLGVLRLALPDARRGRRRPQGRVPRRASTSPRACSASTRRSTTRTSATPTSSSASKATSRSGSAGARSPISSSRSAASTPSTPRPRNLKLPAMRRLTCRLLKDNPRITLRLYFALTSEHACSSAPSSSSTSGSSASRSAASSASTCCADRRRSSSTRTCGRAWRSRPAAPTSARSALDLALVGPDAVDRARQGQFHDPVLQRQRPTSRPPSATSTTRASRRAGAVPSCSTRFEDPRAWAGELNPAARRRSDPAAAAGRDRWSSTRRGCSPSRRA